MVRSPETGTPFTEDGAWAFIVAALDDPSIELEEIILDKPPGKKGYVMKISLRSDEPRLYIKLQLGDAGKIIARSFHLSDIND